jgi:hypothetical protein
MLPNCQFVRRGVGAVGDLGEQPVQFGLGFALRAFEGAINGPPSASITFNVEF